MIFAFWYPQAAASFAKVENVKMELERFRLVSRGAGGVRGRHELAHIAHACAATVCSPAVVEAFAGVVTKLCSDVPANRASCGATGVIPVIVAGLSAHCATSVVIAICGCQALASLAAGYTVNVDAIVCSAGGLDAILASMASHPHQAEVQRCACVALMAIARVASDEAKAVIRASGAARLLESAAKCDRYTEGRPGAVKDCADLVLDALRRMK